MQNDSYHTGNLWQKQGYDSVPQSCTHALIMKTFSLQLSASFTVSFQQLQQSTGCTEHIHFYYGVIRPRARVLSVCYTTQQGMENSLCSEESHTVPSALPLTWSTIALVLFVCLFYHQECWVHGSDGIPDPIPACNQARLQLQWAAGSGKTVLNASSPRAGACPDVSWNGSGRPVAHRCLLAWSKSQEYQE